MRCKKRHLALAAICAVLSAAPNPQRPATAKATARASAAKPTFSGASAFAFTRAVVNLGPRVPGTDAHTAVQKLIVANLTKSGCQIEQDRFTANTPLGPKPMNNIIAKVPGKSGRLVAISGHYDTKLFEELRFVGANDGGSSTGFLLELARSLCRKPSTHDVYLVFLDGEEAFRTWTAQDSLYGSRHLATRWRKDGTLSRLIALINVDMIGDRDLQLINDQSSTQWLRTMIWESAATLGYGKHFSNEPSGVTDDHIPFLEAGAAAVDLIDFSYGPTNAYWHTERDTIDKLSASSFQVVGEVVLHALARLQK